MAWHGTTSHCIASHCVASHCIASRCSPLRHCTALHRAAPHRTALPCLALHRVASHFVASHCAALHRPAPHCIASTRVFLLRGVGAPPRTRPRIRTPHAQGSPANLAPPTARGSHPASQPSQPGSQPVIQPAGQRAASWPGQPARQPASRPAIPTEQLRGKRLKWENRNLTRGNKNSGPLGGNLKGGGCFCRGPDNEHESPAHTPRGSSLTSWSRHQAQGTQLRLVFGCSL